MGEGVLVYFGYPEAHEDDAERAVRIGGHRRGPRPELCRQARPPLELAASLYRPEEHREFAFRYGQDIGASASCYLSSALWHAALLAVLSRDVLRVEQLANDNATVSTQHGFPFGRACSRVQLGGAAAQRDEAPMASIGCAAVFPQQPTPDRRCGSLCFLGLVTEALAFAGEVEEGIAKLDQALA
jgi:hypothetical protein